jgi:hypothetical protein
LVKIKTFFIFVKIKIMDTTTIVNDYLENPAMDFENFSDFQAIAEDYNYQLLMEELKQEINS